MIIRALLQRFIFWFMGTWTYKKVCCWLVRSIRLPCFTRIRARKAERIECDLWVGDVLLVGNPWALQAWAIPGRYDHGAKVVKIEPERWQCDRCGYVDQGGTGQNCPQCISHGELDPGVMEYHSREVIIGEMTACGYGEVSFIPWVQHYSRLKVRRPTNYDSDYQKQEIHIIRGLEGVPYDDQFAFGPEAVYCFELCVIGDIENRIEYQPSHLVGTKRMYISGDDLAASPSLRTIAEV